MGHRPELSPRHIQVSCVPQLRASDGESSDSTRLQQKCMMGWMGWGKGSGLSPEAETENSVSMAERRSCGKEELR